MAVAEINEVGGYLGCRLELVIRDDRADPSQALIHAQDLVQAQKVVASIAFCNTGNAMKALDVLAKRSTLANAAQE